MDYKDCRGLRDQEVILDPLVSLDLRVKMERREKMESLVTGDLPTAILEGPPRPPEDKGLYAAGESGKTGKTGTPGKPGTGKGWKSWCKRETREEGS